MQRETTGNGFFEIFKGAGLALALSFLSAIMLANVMRFSPLPDKVIYPVNQTVKVIVVLVGSLAFVRGEKGFLKGLGVGLIFTALSYLAFSAIGGDFSLSWLIIVEVLLSAFSGAVGGAIAVNMRRS